MSLDLLFKPKTVVIYNASSKLYYFIEGFKNSGFNLENLFLISSREKELFGIPCHENLDDIPFETIDLLIMAERREALVESLKKALNAKNIRFIHLFTAGTGETDDLGKEIEQEIKEILDQFSETRAIGPNCMGVYCPLGHNTYSPAFPTQPGVIGLIFQSGDLHTKMIAYGYRRYKITYSKGVSVGNCIDLKIHEFLQYYDEDQETKVICIYFEGFPQYGNDQGRKLYNALKNVKKPVLMLRGGRTKRAQTAVLTHTGTLGSLEHMWDALYNQTTMINAGVILDDLIDKAYLFNEFLKRYEGLSIEEQRERYPKSKNTLVILWSGGLGIIDTDLLTELGLNLPYFRGRTKEKLLDVYPLKIGSLSNPLDLPWIVAEDIFAKICTTAVSSEIDLVILETDVPLHWDDDRMNRYYDNLRQIKDHVNSIEKTFILILPEYPHKKRYSYYERLINDGFIVYPSIRRAAKSFIGLFDFGVKLRTLQK